MRAAVDDERPAGDDAIGQDQVAAARTIIGPVGLAGAPVHVHVELVALERQREPTSGAARNTSRSSRFSSAASPFSSGAVSTSTPGALGRRKLAIVEIVAVERDQRAAQLAREPVVLAVARAAQVVVLDHEQHVPVEQRAHEAPRDRAGMLAST